MLLHCEVCNTKNNVLEIQELEDIKDFTDRLLIIGKCKVCNSDIALLVEIRKADNKTFIDNLHGNNAKKVIKRESKRIKNKQNLSSEKQLNGWVYGVNKEIKDKKGNIKRVRQYACDYSTNKKRLEKTIVTK